MIPVAKRLLLERGPVIRRTIILIVAGVGPLIILPSVAIDNFVIPKFFVVSTLITLWTVIWLLEAAAGRTVAALPSAWLPGAAVCLALTVAWVASPYKPWSLMGEYYRYTGLLPALLFAWLAIAVGLSFPSGTQRLATVLCGAGAVISLYTLLQEMNLDPISWRLSEDRAISTIGNSNFTAGVLAMLLPVAIGRPDQRLWRKIGFVLLIAAGLLTTRSLGGIAAGCAGAAIVVAHRVRTRFPWSGPVSIAAVLSLAAAVTIVVASSISSPDAIAGGSRSISSRAGFWQAAANMSSDMPFVGRGPNAFAFESAKYRTVANARVYGYRLSSDPHNVFFAYVTSAGILGAGAFIVLLLWVTRRGLGLWRQSGDDPIQAGFLGLCVAYLIQSLVSIDDVTIRLLLWIGIGVLGTMIAEPNATTDVPDPVSQRSRTAGGLLILGAAVCLLLLMLPFRLLAADVSARAAVASFRSGDVENGIDTFQKAIDFRGDYFYRRTFAAQLGRSAIAAPQEGSEWIAMAREQFEAFSELNHVRSLVNEARMLTSWAVFEPEAAIDAAALYERAISVDPKNPFIGIEASELFVRMGRTREALTTLESYLPISAEYDQFWGAFALVHAELGNQREAHVFGMRALANDPDDRRAQRALEIIRSD